MRIRTDATRIALAALAIALVVGACSNSSSPSASASGESAAPSSSTEASGTVTIGSEQANDHGSQDVSGKTSFELEQDDFYFSPTIISGSPGQKLTLEIKNEGTAEHNFSLPSESIDKSLQPGTNTTVTITFPKSGTAVFFCKFHRSSGMLGELTTK
jgi:plastocyanin